MPQPPAEFQHPAPTLSCLVVGGDPSLSAQLDTRLRRSTRVTRVERLSDAISLEHALAVRAHDLVVYVLSAPDEPLPRCLRTRAQLRVLVIAPDGVAGTLARWLQQGATDLVSPDDEDGLAHALSRLLDECALLATVRRQETVIATQRRRLTALSAVNERAPATGPHVTGHERMTLRPVDSADGLPGRRQSLKRLIALQARAGGAESADHAVALQITLPFADGDAGSRLDRTLGDLAIYRAAETARRVFGRRLLLGRTRRNTLVVLFACGSDGHGSVFGHRLRRAMGSLGELLERESDLTIDAIDGTLADLAAPNLFERLERLRERRAASRDNGPNVPVLPVLVARSRSDRGMQTADASSNRLHA